jgi:tetratricopeptide (TPR) repeat protein
MEDATAQNQHNLRRLVWSIQSSYGRLNLLIAICDNRKYRDELIHTYETELSAKGARCYRVRIDPRQPSLKQHLQDWMEQAQLEADSPPIVMTILGADELLSIRLDQSKSAQEQFFFSLQWTRESLRAFQFPIVLWLTPSMASTLAQQAPDFWSWRGGVFEFSKPTDSTDTDKVEQMVDRELEPTEQSLYPVANPADLQQQINDLLAQDPESPLLASLYNSLANLYESQGQYDEAEPLYFKALQLRKELLGDRHPAVATSLNNLAGLYESQGRYEEAEPLLVEALQLFKDLLGERHPDVATSLNNLAALYWSQGRYEEAEPLYVEALQMSKELLGQSHPYVAQSLNNLAALYKSQGRYEEAEPLLVKALQLRKELLGERHPAVATSLNNLAALYESQGRYEEAEPLYLEALQICINTLGTEHPNTVTVRENFSLFVRAVVEAGRAEELSDHPLTQEALQHVRANLR